MDLSHLGKREASEDHNTISSPSGGPAAKKPRGQSTSSRGVANLTAEQLAKKRANDRDAQRAIRERTKNTIETLEAKIRELTTQQPYQELQHILRLKEQVEAENADIKKRLASVLAMIGPIMGQHAPHTVDPSYSSPGQPYTQHHASGSNLNSSTPTSVPSPTAAGSQGSWQAPAASMMSHGHGDERNSSHARVFSQQRNDLATGLNIGPERLGLDFLLDTHRASKIPHINGSTSSPAYRSPKGKPDSGVSMHERSRSRESLHSRSHDAHANELLAHSAPVRNCGPTCPLDGILLEFLADRQRRASEGETTPKLVGPAYPSVSSLLNPAVPSHDLSRVFTDILGTFPDISTLPEKVAVLYVMFLFMRWQISPTQENYDRLPEWMTPRPSQLFTPHAAWIDHLPHPRMRDRLVRDFALPEYHFENFFIPFTSTLSLNWPYEPEDVLISTNDHPELSINPVFERHLFRLENWTLGQAFADTFPGLIGTFRPKDEKR